MFNGFFKLQNVAVRSPSDQKERLLAFLIASVTTLLFFYPSLRDGGQQAGYVSSDAWHVMIAQFHVAAFYMSHGVFSGIDYFTENGASEYFLRPNLPVYDPFILILAPIFVHFKYSMIVAYVLISAMHAFIGVYALQRLGTRFFNFDIALAAFVAVTFIFSIQVVNYSGQLSFVLIAWMMPAAIYGGLMGGRYFNPVTVLFASLPYFLIFTAGYVVLAVAATLISLVFIGLVAWYEKIEASPRDRVRFALHCLAPVALASAVAAPLFLGINSYHKTVEIANRIGSEYLYPVAIALAEDPKNFVRLFAKGLVISGSMFETYIFWGLIPVAVFILYIAQYTRSALHKSQRNVLLFGSMVIYAFSALIIFGSHSALTEIFYYFAPIFGYMHVYQRYLLLSQIFLSIFIGIMLNDVAGDARRGLAKWMIVIFGVVLLSSVGLMGREPSFIPSITDDFIFELFLVLIFLMSMVFSGRIGTLISATVCCFLLSCGSFYHFSDYPGRYLAAMTNEQLTYSPAATSVLTNYMRSNSSKSIIKYIDLLPSSVPFVPKNLPWFALGSVKLSSYYGYDWHLGTDFGFRRIMGITVEDGDLVFRPDWEWLRLSGAEFVIFEDGLKSNDPLMARYVDLSPAKLLHFSGGAKNYIAAPLKFEPIAGDPIVFDNGYVRVHSKDTAAKVTGFKTNDAGNLSLTVDSSTPAQLEYLFWPNKHLRAEIDGVHRSIDLTDRMQRIPLPAGKHTVSIFYRQLALQIFTALYSLYAVCVIAMAGFCGYGMMRRWRLQLFDVCRRLRVQFNR